jgi:threonine/homoserine/homoserine lactone efflux protein
MDDAALIAAFCAAALKAAVPGPSVVLVLARGAQAGAGRGAMVAAGVLAANAVFLAAGLMMASAGVALSGEEIALFRWVGVAVTLALAARMVMLAARDRAAEFRGGDVASGLGVGLASPHNLAFYIVLAPPLLAEAHGGGMTLADVAAPSAAIMAGVLAVNVVLVAVASAAQGLHARHGRWFGYVGAAAMLACSGALAAADRLV